jgi:hypothetical protein
MASAPGRRRSSGTVCLAGWLGGRSSAVGTGGVEVTTGVEYTNRAPLNIVHLRIVCARVVQGCVRILGLP